MIKRHCLLLCQLGQHLDWTGSGALFNGNQRINQPGLVKARIEQAGLDIGFSSYFWLDYWCFTG